MLSLSSKATFPTEQTEWERWAQQLKRWGLSSFVASLLEAGGAFATLAAQSLYVSQPLLESWPGAKTVRSLAKMLEAPDQSAAFAELLRQTK